jgi:hypothetical protein
MSSVPFGAGSPKMLDGKSCSLQCISSRQGSPVLNSSSSFRQTFLGEKSMLCGTNIVIAPFGRTSYAPVILEILLLCGE